MLSGFSAHQVFDTNLVLNILSLGFLSFISYIVPKSIELRGCELLLQTLVPEGLSSLECPVSVLCGLVVAVSGLHT